MKVCHISMNLCPRVAKLAYVQLKRGIQTRWITLRGATYQRTVPFEYYKFGSELRFGGMKNAIMDMANDVDLFHIHTHMRDTSLLQDARIIEGLGKKWVWDCHDDPGSFVFDRLPDLAPNENLLGPEGIAYRSLCSEDWFAKPSMFTNGIVIATGLSNVPGHFRYWLDVFEGIKNLGYPLTCYTSSEIPDQYRKVADMRGPIDIKQLIQEFSHFSFGLCGSPHPDKNMLTAQPNKFFEYLAAGIPIICFGKQHDMAKIIHDWGLGTSINSIDELPEAMHYIDHLQCKERVLDIREVFCMEQEEPKVRELYERVLKCK